MDVMQSSRNQHSLDENLDKTIDLLRPHLTPTIPRNVMEYGSFINNTLPINKMVVATTVTSSSPTPNIILNNGQTPEDHSISYDNYSYTDRDITKETNSNEMKNILNTLEVFSQNWPKPPSPLKPIDPNDKDLLLSVKKENLSNNTPPTISNNNTKSSLSLDDKKIKPIKLEKVSLSPPVINTNPSLSKSIKKEVDIKQIKNLENDTTNINTSEIANENTTISSTSTKSKSGKMKKSNSQTKANNVSIKMEEDNTNVKIESKSNISKSTNNKKVKNKENKLVKKEDIDSNIENGK